MTNRIPLWAWPLLVWPFALQASLAAGLLALALWPTIDTSRSSPTELATTSGTSTLPTPAARKTMTREEIRKIWESQAGGSPEKTRAIFGPPDQTSEEFEAWRLRSSDPFTPVSSGVNKIDVWRYDGLSVDAAGSGKVDTAVIFKFGTLDGNLRFVP